MIFSIEDRETLREELVAAARRDQRLSGAAMTGSASVGRADRWSDIDLAFGVRNTDDLPQVMSDWTDTMYERYGAVHHLDVPVGATVYRVFLLPSTLQVDIAFSPASEFGARGATFRLLFGRAADTDLRAAPVQPERLIGMGWLYALHARSCIARGRLWQAEHMVSALRDQVLALNCLLHGLPVAHARGADQLPHELIAPLEGALVRCLEREELSHAFGVALDALRHAIRCQQPSLAARLDAPLRLLVVSEPE